MPGMWSIGIGVWIRADELGEGNTARAGTGRNAAWAGTVGSLRLIETSTRFVHEVTGRRHPCEFDVGLAETGKRTSPVDTWLIGIVVLIRLLVEGTA